ncbi:hypothetical protein LSTR_LSTR001980 [Laodelphax striatellus]|uniref:DUF4485 domain-containing protein n=1 Tax=Laodelphax striatellus TaxID=195883 RepID=A0A482XHN1_LAOST|nr:hypothetical protein LSTR_LSTR001980 [Laodelphax striatellus]
MADEEDDEEPQPQKYGFSVESKLDEDHLFYLQFTNNFISNVTRPRDYDHCVRWLERLAGEPMYGIEAKRNRNMYLAQLLVAMQDNKVKGPFAGPPPHGKLPNAGEVFGLAPKSEDDGGIIEDADRELNMADYQYESEDGRLYIASCALPNNSGVMAYVGLTFGGGEGLWLNKDGEPMRQEEVLGNEDNMRAITTETKIKKQLEYIQEYIDALKTQSGSDSAVKHAKDAYRFLIGLPVTRSDIDVLEVGRYRLTKDHREILEDLYPDELVEWVQDLLVKSKKDIEQRYKLRLDRIIGPMYKSYAEEIEKGLIKFKEARLVWQEVNEVLAELKESMDERDAKLAAASKPAKNDDKSISTAEPLMKSLQESEDRLKKNRMIGQEFNDKIAEIHRIIHDSALFHMRELAKLNSHISNLTQEICNLRKENKKKMTIIKTLNLNKESLNS